MFTRSADNESSFVVLDPRLSYVNKRWDQKLSWSGEAGAVQGDRNRRAVAAHH